MGGSAGKMDGPAMRSMQEADLSKQSKIAYDSFDDVPYTRLPREIQITINNKLDEMAQSKCRLPITNYAVCATEKSDNMFGMINRKKYCKRQLERANHCLETVDREAIKADLKRRYLMGTLFNDDLDRHISRAEYLNSSLRRKLTDTGVGTW
eukprot:TRINITY_DN106456_c0_g1_i1.p1 TRINITY_DN106456_c0_g1~~TRINITY_DN106456_c0_g1_i1.p1  ORF type:complete len:166 (-),score=11.55 TRINITY_DN106456_c0_g1_i1:188-643(-)